MIDLSFFCGIDDFRIDKPFSIGKYTYATCGYMLVRVDRREDIGERENAPEADKLEIKASGDGRWIVPDEISLPEKTECGNCSGAGFICKCEECDSEGYLILYSDYNLYEVECKSCGGEGHVPASKDDGNTRCACCCGSGKCYESYSSTKIDGFEVANNLLSKAFTLPGIKIFLRADSDYTKPIPFVFYGGNGAIMAMNPD